jgi:ubiquinone/menaquinone biosynthesis C-methylase UbiE
MDKKEFFKRLLLYPNIIPPIDRMRAGKDIRNYVIAGKRMREVLEKYAGLTPDSKVLDVGCGDGRLANNLSRYMKHGSYDGFDVQFKFIEFLQKAYCNKQNITFKHADLWHSYYNPKGVHKPEEYVFPYNNKQFDVLFLNSIFSHFLPDTIFHYLREIARVLKLNGRVVFTCFIVNEEAKHYDTLGISAPHLLKRHKHILNNNFGNYWTRDDDIREMVVGIEEAWLKKACSDADLNILEIVPGYWCGRPKVEDIGCQDIVVATTIKDCY